MRPDLVAVGLIVGAYLALAIAAAIIVPHDPTDEPRLTPPDESAHWLFVDEMVRDRRLPVFRTDGSNYEAHQPPLYYLSVAWTYLLAGKPGIEFGRLWSVLLGGATLLVVWQMAGVLLPPRGRDATAQGDAPWLRVAAVGALAFIPGRLFIVSSVSNDALFELLSAATLWQALVAARDGMDTKRAGIVGALLGLALLTKTSALVLCPVVALAVLCEPRWRRQGLRCLLANAGIVLGACGVLWGWWVARNLSLYGEPLAVDIFQRVFIKDRPGPGFFLRRGLEWSDYWMLVASQTWMSLWGVFGQATVYMPKLFYGLGRLLAGLALVGYVLQWYRHRTESAGEPAAKEAKPSQTRRGKGAQPTEAPLEAPGARRGLSWIAYGLAALLVLLTAVTFMRFNMVFYQAQARYFLGVSGPLACVLAAGICGLAPRGKEAVPAVAGAGVLLVMCLWAVVAHATGGYSFMPPG